MALPNNENTCRILNSEIRQLRAKIERLKRNLMIDESILDRGIENRIKVIIENGQMRRVPTLSEQEILEKTNRLRRKIEKTKAEIRASEKELNKLGQEFNHLGCSKWVSFF